MVLRKMKLLVLMLFVPLHTAFDSKVKLKLLRFLLGNYTQMAERECARVIGVSYMSVNRLMREFSALDLVYSKRVGNVMLWEVNKGSLAYRELKTAMQAIVGLEDPFKHLVKTIEGELSKHRVLKATLFGSVAQHKERPGSDVDLFVLVANGREKQRVKNALHALNGRFLQLYGNPLSPYVLTVREFEHPANPFLMENIKKGISLNVKKIKGMKNG